MSTMNPSRLGRPVDADRRAARRRQIINGARGVFARKGFHAASTAEISAEAGVSGANLYQYFATKDDLIMSLIEENLAGDLALIESLNDAKSLKQGIMSLGKALFETPPGRQSHALRLEILAESFRQEEVAATLRRAEIRMIDTLGAIIGKAQVSGEVPDEISTLQAAATIIACVDGFMSRIAFTPISAEAQLAGFVMLITAALRLQQS
ncbi:TetR family transcriptional regulator [Massilia sp. CCM 8695]|uniref:TetR family transcriptional regulator n=2 Tax=Massilia frigida TaxID=2609281 RepID=A0ABX0NK62_9BURK|nr:TetR family transcriptional regulator [Massilia frigida]